MLQSDWLRQFEQAAIARNPILATKLQPGLPEARVQRVLRRAGVAGNIAPLYDLYTWKDGTDLTFSPLPSRVVPDFYESQKAKTSFFAGKPYFFICLEMAIGHFGHLEAALRTQPRLKEGVNRYFPVFWDGSSEWLSVDLKPVNGNRIMIVDSRADQPFSEAYSSFEEFIADAIRANEENRPLRCFQSN